MVIYKDIHIGYVAKETDDTIVVFGDSDNSRYDIPKSEVIYGGRVIIKNNTDILQYKVNKDSPLPQGSGLRPSAETIRSIANRHDENNLEEGKKTKKITTPEAIIMESQELDKKPRARTTKVSRPINYYGDIDNNTELEIIKKVKSTVNEFKDIIAAAAMSAKNKIKEKQELVQEKQANIDSQQISKMGDMATHLANSFEDVLYEICTRPYAEQEQIYNGFLKLIDTQRELIVARRDLAARLKNPVQDPVANPESIHQIKYAQLPEPQQYQLPVQEPMLTLNTDIEMKSSGFATIAEEADVKSNINIDKGRVKQIEKEQPGERKIQNTNI